jgi:transposase InsO family protein
MVWIFVAVDHCHGECVGWHVAKFGSRFAALQPIAMGLLRHRQSVERGAGHGLSLRLDHGSQYIADDFLHQIRAWSITPSFAFVREPETNGVAERFIRTLKEQAIYGRVFRDLEELRSAVEAFVELFNQQWRLEKNGFLTPAEVRAAAALKAAA